MEDDSEAGCVNKTELERDIEIFLGSQHSFESVLN